MLLEILLIGMGVLYDMGLHCNLEGGRMAWWEREIFFWVVMVLCNHTTMLLHFKQAVAVQQSTPL